MRFWQSWRGDPLVDEVRASVRERDWKRAVRGALVLLRYHPLGLALLNEQRMQRHRISRRFWNRKREFQDHERQLKRREKALKEQRQETQRLRLQVRKLDRRLRRSTVVGAEQRIWFFLVGEMKSGTSWLMNMLHSHPEIFCKGEGSFFGRGVSTEEMGVYKAPAPSLYSALSTCEGLRTWQSLSWNSWSKGQAEEDARNLTRLATDYYLAKGSARSGKRIVGDKSPLHVDHVDEIFDLYPEAKIIHIVRDGRDVAVSLMFHFWNLARDNKDGRGIYDLEPEELAKRDDYFDDPDGFLASGNSIFIEERLRQIAVRWNRRASKASREGPKLFGSSFFQLRYEDLIERPEEYLKVIFDLLGARTDDDVIRRCVEENSFEKKTGRPRGHEDSRKFMRKGVAGDWRRVFTERDRRVYENIAGDTLAEMGYSLD